ncbi:SUMF1/EgtB/PvdO family nonheme iron enzyme [Thauera sp. 2A1]
MASEVLEWCANQHNLAGDMPGRQGEESQRALRGGSGHIDRDLARCTARLGDHPRGRYPSVGFRQCHCPPSCPLSRPSTLLSANALIKHVIGHCPA